MICNFHGTQGIGSISSDGEIACAIVKVRRRPTWSYTKHSFLAPSNSPNSNVIRPPALHSK